MSKNNLSPIDADFAGIFFKPIAHYLENPDVAEVMVNAYDDIWVEDNTGLRKVPEVFTPDALVSAVNSLAQYVGRPLMENVFSVDARMPDGSRVCIVLPPVSGQDPIFAIRRFKEVVSDLDFLVDKKSLTSEMVDFIDACVQIKKNVMVSGGTSSGKTTLLNLIAAQIPDEDRIITIEDSRELQLKQEHVLSLEGKPADKHGKGEFSIRQCLKSTLRLRPDRIIVGEIRSGEAFDLVQAMNTGHGGCMGTVHANAPTDTLRRIESLALMADVDMPLIALRSMVASALDLIICPARLSDGSRRIVQIAEIGPLTEKGDYTTVDICKFVSTKRNRDTGRIEGYFEFTGHVPSFYDMFEAEGVHLPENFFRKRVMGDVPESVIPKLLENGYEVPGHNAPAEKPREKKVEKVKEEPKVEKVVEQAPAFEMPITTPESVQQSGQQPIQETIPEPIQEPTESLIPPAPTQSEIQPELTAEPIINSPTFEETPFNQTEEPENLQATSSVQQGFIPEEFTSDEVSPQANANFDNQEPEDFSSDISSQNSEEEQTTEGGGNNLLNNLSSVLPFVGGNNAEETNTSNTNNESSEQPAKRPSILERLTKIQNAQTNQANNQAAPVVNSQPEPSNQQFVSDDLSNPISQTAEPVSFDEYPSTSSFEDSTSPVASNQMDFGEPAVNQGVENNFASEPQENSAQNLGNLPEFTSDQKDSFEEQQINSNVADEYQTNTSINFDDEFSQSSAQVPEQPQSQNLNTPQTANLDEAQVQPNANSFSQDFSQDFSGVNVQEFDQAQTASNTAENFAPPSQTSSFEEDFSFQDTAQAQPEEPAQSMQTAGGGSQPESKQHAVIAEILKRMKANKSSEESSS